MATKRLRKDLIQLRTEPPPGVIAEPDESNILKWHYAIRGPTETPYQGGVYVGKLVFPSEYPMKAPSVYMLTPSGRFQTSTKICMSMSDFHPESWNPLWTVATILQGIQSFMAGDDLTTGGLEASEADRKTLAGRSVVYNQRRYPDLFEGDIGAALEAADRLVESKSKAASKAAGGGEEETKASAKNAVGSSSSNGSSNTNGNNATSTSTSRRSRRMAKMAAASNNNNNNNDNKEEEEKTKQSTAQPDDENRNNSENNNTSTNTNNTNTPSAAAAKQEPTPEEIEKRRKKNAKKRAKQKAKKSAVK